MYFVEICCPTIFAKFLAEIKIFCKMKDMVFQIFWMQTDIILNTPVEKLMSIPRQLHGSQIDFSLLCKRPDFIRVF